MAGVGKGSRGVGLICLGLLGLVACRFDTSTAASPRDSGPSIPDADPNRPDAIAPSDCPEDIFIQLSVNGISTAPGDGEPFSQVLLGDTVALSAMGTCTRSGTINYEWSIDSAIDQTAFPSISSESMTVYSATEGTFNVTLVVNDGSTDKTAMVSGFAVTGFQALDLLPDADTKDLHAGADFLWIGNKAGAFVADLANPTVGPDQGDYEAVNDKFGGGSSIPADVRAVFENPAGDYVWFGPNANEGKIYRLDLNGDQQTVSIDTIAGARNKDISAFETKVYVATDRGVARSNNVTNFQEVRADSSEAVSAGATGEWSGANNLYPLPAGPSIDLFGGDNKIKGLADDGVDLWVGSDAQGAARYRPGVIPTLYTLADGLSSLKVRALTVDASGDIWAATEVGASRFKKDRQAWVALSTAGLPGDKKLKAITVDESGGRRAIYVGGTQGFALMRVPITIP
jgi:hypothetical protein